MSARRRAALGFAVLLTLFVALIGVQLFVGDRLQARHAAHLDRLTAARDANRAVLQNMTDAETGVRGFQLTGAKVFLEPYDHARLEAFAALDTVADRTTDQDTLRLLTAERQAAVHWLYAYAIPIVNAGVADNDEARAERGKEMFDQLRNANADVDAAIDSGIVAAGSADQRASELAELLFAVLAVVVLCTGLALRSWHIRHLLRPLDHIRDTIQRLAAGERDARAATTGLGELQAVAVTLNDLADETSRLLDAEKARAVRHELRQAVAAELRSGRDTAEAARRVMELIGHAFGADAVHSRVTVERGQTVETTWPDGAPGPEARVVREIRSAESGTVLNVAAGAVSVTLSGDLDCPPGLIHVLRRDRATWTEEERKLLASLGGEIDYAVRQERLQRRQSGLISELRTLDEQKDVFVSTVTHELRTPLTSILGYCEALADAEPADLAPPVRRAVVAILRNAHRLEATVGDLLLLGDAGKAGGPGADGNPVDLAALAATVHADLVPAARAKDVTSSIATQPAWVRGNGAQLERALRNLLDNGIKFTPSGGRVELQLRREDDQVVIAVTDTGMGIPADDVPGLFTPFHRAANAMHLAVQGNGLGLAIVRTIATEHGGTISATSSLDEGSVFTLTLPSAEPADK